MLLRLCPLCSDLLIELFLPRNEVVCILLCLGCTVSLDPGTYRVGRPVTFFFAAISFCTALTCLLMLFASKSTVPRSRQHPARPAQGHLVRTLHPVRVHLDDLVDDLDRETSLLLRFADFLGISALAVDKL